MSDLDQPIQRYPAHLAAASAIVRPIWTCRHLGERTTAQEMWHAWMTHLAVLLGLVALVFLSTTLNDAVHNFLAEPQSAASDSTIDNISEAIDQIAGEARLPGFVIAGGFAVLCFMLIEVCTLASAVLLMPLASRSGESWITGYLRTLKRLWLLSAVGVGPLVVATLSNLVIQVLDSLYRDGARVNPNWSDILFVLYLVTIIALVWWPLMLVVRAMGADGSGACCRWPATCEGCGYNLLGVGQDQACPECGRPVKESIPGSLRSGTPVQREADASWLAWMFAVGRTWLTGWWPRAHSIGRSMQLYDHRETFAATALAVMVGFFIIALAGAVANWVLIVLLEPAGWQSIVFIPIAAAWTALWAVGVWLALLLGLSLLVGLLRQDADGRPMFSASFRAGVALSGFCLWVWAGFWVVIFGLMLFGLTGAARTLVNVLGISHGLLELVLTFTAMGAAVTAVAAYAWLVWRTMLELRWANV